MTPKVGQTWKIRANPLNGDNQDLIVNIVHWDVASARGIIATPGFTDTNLVSEEFLQEFGEYLPNAPVTLEEKNFDAECGREEYLTQGKETP